jgi:hypothetical protein
MNLTKPGRRNISPEKKEGEVATWFLLRNLFADSKKGGRWGRP